MGLKAQDTSELFFEDVRLPASALLVSPPPLYPLFVLFWYITWFGPSPSGPDIYHEPYRVSAFYSHTIIRFDWF